MQRQNNGGVRGGAGGKPPKEELYRFHKAGGQDDLSGIVIHRRYELLGRIGGGGVADIYLALDRQRKEKVAVKVITQQGDSKYAVPERLFVEAKAAKSIDNPHVIQIYDIGTFADRIFCVMEYVAGEDLSKVLEREKWLPWQRARDLGIQACEALEAAHGVGIIHRDMKPANIMLTYGSGGETLKLLDLGLAKFTSGEDGLTRENVILGTLSYMAPEQAWTQEYGPAVDIYALGIMLFEMVSGRVPFQSGEEDEKARALKVLLMHKDMPPPLPSAFMKDRELPIEFEAAILKAMRKSPEERFGSAAEMREALAKCGAPAEEDDPPPVIEEAKADYGAAHRKVVRILGAPPVKDESLLPSPRRLKRWLLAGVLGAAIAFGYYHRDRVMETVENVRQMLTESKPEPQEAPAPTPTRTSYESLIESEPAGAVVHEIGGGERRRLGTTPLRIYLMDGEHTVEFSKGGFHTETAVLTSAQPNTKASLRPVKRRSREQRDAGEIRLQPVEIGGQPEGDEISPPRPEEGDGEL